MYALNTTCVVLHAIPYRLQHAQRAALSSILSHLYMLRLRIPTLYLRPFRAREYVSRVRACLRRVCVCVYVIYDCERARVLHI